MSSKNLLTVEEFNKELGGEFKKKKIIGHLGYD